MGEHRCSSEDCEGHFFQLPSFEAWRRATEAVIKDPLQIAAVKFQFSSLEEGTALCYTCILVLYAHGRAELLLERKL